MTIAEFKKINATTKTQYNIFSRMGTLKFKAMIIIDYLADCNDLSKELKEFEKFKDSEVKTLDIVGDTLLVNAIAK